MHTKRRESTPGPCSSSTYASGSHRVSGERPSTPGGENTGKGSYHTLQCSGTQLSRGTVTLHRTNHGHAVARKLCNAHPTLPTQLLPEPLHGNAETRLRRRDQRERRRSSVENRALRPHHSSCPGSWRLGTIVSIATAVPVKIRHADRARSTETLQTDKVTICQRTSTAALRP